MYKYTFKTKFTVKEIQDEICNTKKYYLETQALTKFYR